ncbi:MAG TPA: hypothetical protein VF773_10475 [Verrucomicrobiae bacterium]
MLTALLIFHFVACVALIIFSAFRMTRGITLMNAFVIIFTLCGCMGVSLFGFFQESLPAVQYSDVALYRALVANLIFVICATAALALEAHLFKRKAPHRTAFRIIPTGFEVKAIVVAASLFITGFLTIWLGKAGKLENPFAAYKETGGSGQYYQYRKLIEEDVSGRVGEGTFTAKKLSFNISPLILILLAYLFYKTKNVLYLALLVLQSIPPLMVAGILAHKSYLLVAIAAPVLALGVWKLKGYSAAIVVSILAVLFVIGGTAIFHATLNSTVGVAAGELFARVFLVPAFTPIFYYEVVPDALPFRGLLQSLYIYHVQAPAWDYAIYDVAHHATGKPYGANAHFLAVGFTGAGFAGVLFVVLLCLALILLFDYFLIELEPSHRLVAICCSGFGFISILSINLLGAFENGFLLGSLVFYALCRGIAASNTPPQTEAGVPLLPSNATA